MTEAKGRLIDPANFFLTASLLIGLLYCIVIPYGAGFDEERHLVRIYYMSQGHILPNPPKPSIYELYAELSYQRRLVQSPAFDMFRPENFLRRFGDAGEKLRYGQKTQSIYSPFIFLPQALIGRILWWHFDFPFLPTVILQRIAGLLIYITGAYIAIRMVPFGKWIFAALALLPSMLYQAATLNADSYTTAVSYAFIGWVLAVYVNEKKQVQPRSVWTLVLLSILLGLAKPGAIVLLPLLLILFKHSFSSKKWVFVLLVAALLAIAANVVWWAIASKDSTFSESGGQSVSRQANQLISDPNSFIQPLFESIVLTLPDQARGMVAAYGYWAGIVPGPVYFFAFLFLLAALFAEPKIQIASWVRIFLAGTLIVCFFVIYTIAFVANYSDSGLYALAKHGRYYIPFIPLIFLGVAGLYAVRENMQPYIQIVVVGLFVTVTGYYSFGIYTTYYTYCGYDAYVGGKCILPIYKNLERDNAPEISIPSGGLLAQSFVNHCGDLENVQVSVKSIPDDPAARLQFSVFDENNQTVASQEFSSADLIPGDFLSLPISPPFKNIHATFTIRLEAVNISPAGEIVVLASSKPYVGPLSLNGNIRSDNLLMHYICAGP